MPRATLDEKLAQLDLSDMQLINPNLKSFTFDKKKGKWCEIELEVYWFVTAWLKFSTR